MREVLELVEKDIQYPVSINSLHVITKVMKNMKTMGGEYRKKIKMKLLKLKTKKSEIRHFCRSDTTKGKICELKDKAIKI